LLISGWLSLLLLLLLGSLLSRASLLAVGLLLVLRLRRSLLPIVLFVFFLLTKGRSIEGEGERGGPCKVKHSLPNHFSYLPIT
jgi:hypothetical protein